MKILIIGYGSIGKRHYEVLSSFDNIKKIDIVSRHSKRAKFKSIYVIKNLNDYDYFIIASKTIEHYEQLKFLENNLKNKIILCEKPLFDTKKDIKIKNNKVFIAYVLRFHPLLKKLKELLKNEKILKASVFCGQYLPTWRKNSDYRNSYSSKKEEGGGVLLDLSHEVDYSYWLFGDFKEIKSYQRKISNLDINSDDFTTLIALSDKNIFINLSVDYISKITNRSIRIDCIENSYYLDFIENTLIKKDKNLNEEIFTLKNLKRNDIFKNMHHAALYDENNDSLCDIDQALDIMNIIYKIQKDNL